MERKEIVEKALIDLILGEYGNLNVRWSPDLEKNQIIISEKLLTEKGKSIPKRKPRVRGSK